MITIKKFTKKINKLGFKVKICDGIIKVMEDSPLDIMIAFISNKSEKVMNFYLYSYTKLDEYTKSKVFYLVTELARTPLKDRADEDRRRIKWTRFIPSPR